MKFKLIFFIALVTILSSCVPKIRYATYSNCIDYEQYTKQGFFLTESNSVSFDYVPIGSVYSAAFSGYVPKEGKSTVISDDLYPTQVKKNINYKDWKSADVDEVIALAVQEAKQKGGNGIINLKIETVTKGSGNESQSGIAITGMVIKR